MTQNDPLYPEYRTEAVIKKNEPLRSCCEPEAASSHENVMSPAGAVTLNSGRVTYGKRMLMSGRSDLSTRYNRHLARAVKLMMLPTFLVAATWPLAAQGGTFTRLNRRDINVTGISADGKIVVGAVSNSGPAFRWAAETGVVEIGGSGFRTVISRDGKTIVSKARFSDM